MWGSFVPQLACLFVRVHVVNALILVHDHDNPYYRHTMDIGVVVADDDDADPWQIFHLAVFGSKHVLHLILL